MFPAVGNSVTAGLSQRFLPQQNCLNQTNGKKTLTNPREFILYDRSEDSSRVKPPTPIQLGRGLLICQSKEIPTSRLWTLLVTFPLLLTKIHDKKKLKGGFILAYCSKVWFIMVAELRQQELGAAGHIVSAIGKLRATNAGTQHTFSF